ncbi:DUF2304 domain-containing protein [Domibacillus epiphyticus]|uniref:DUF2304 domain-containing protein n=1 Tax=Domibacillus epiphyticus TaxID=1714355 RepID=A0A1V2A6L5_9BACI|nr:DUF2304 domain-containing protein [Domibacillus epiphyticus]OMP66645.1 hypothetical protein BTO28_11420 [Domibacillus epiphyticus]
MDHIQFIVIIAAFSFFIHVVFLTSKNKLTDKYAFMWLSFSTIGVLMAIALPFLNQFANWIGVAYLPSLIFLLAFLVVLTLLIYHTQLLSRQEQRIKTLIQEVAFLQKEVQEQRKEEDHS